MAKISAGILKQELLKRAEKAKKASEKPQFTLEQYCFDKQLAFIQDPAKFKTAVCSRRSGKTISCAADLMHTAINQIGDCAYITLNRITAKRIIWRELIKIDKQFELGCTFDNTELTVNTPNGNKIYVTAAKDESDAEKLRGLALRKIYIDESQSFRAFIEGLIDDVLIPTLTDYDGSLVLIGTPGPVPSGYFYSASHNLEWSNHHWTMQDNPWIEKKSGKSAARAIEEICRRRGVTQSDPSIQREYFGQWIKDDNALVFKFNPAINTYAHMPSGDWQYIFGIDIGFNDADAIAVMAYDFKQNTSYLVEEIVKPKQDITSLAEQIKHLQSKYQPIKMVMDAGALGKKIQEELLHRHGLVLEAAAKERKHEFIALLNGDLRSGKFKAFEGSRFAEDCDRVVWDWDDPAKPKISDKYHSDICDSVLYSWKAAMHYIPKAVKEPRMDIRSPAWLEAEEARLAEEVELKKQGHIQDWGVDQDDLDSIFSYDNDTDDMGF